MKYPILDVPLYHCRFIALLNIREDAANRFTKKLLGQEHAKNAGGSCVTDSINGMVHSVIWVPKFSFTPIPLGILAHECLHGCLLTLHDRGQGVDTQDHEHLTYFHQHVFESLLDLYRKK
jgi:hypothetical protein